MVDNATTPANYDLAVDLVEESFSRMQNYPRTGKGISLLAHDLARASKATGASLSAIAQRWAETSDRCPTYHNLLVCGEGIRGQVTGGGLPARFDEKERITETEFRKIVSTIDFTAVRAKEQQRIQEHRAVLAEARKTSEERRRMPAWKLAASLHDHEYSEIRKRLGFTLTPWDRIVLDNETPTRFTR